MNLKLDCLMMAFVAGTCLAVSADTTPLEETLSDGRMQATMSTRPENGLRTYVLKSNAPLRDNRPESKTVEFSETSDHAYARTGSIMFDGLYAMAVHEALLNSVSEISDSAYAQGEPIRLEAFQTGEFWTYVWTRDLAYSVNLSLAGFDPQRAVSSLLFKTSELKPAVDEKGRQQIVQDTGSGGSYPVSSDRVVWAVGAWETLKYLSDNDRKSFLREIYPILHDTIEQDRHLVYDPVDGLYKGEQSFLDWREQTYPGWTKDNVLPIALSKALSVNVLNYYLLTVASECANTMQEKGDAKRYAQWAADLKSAINQHFYDSESGLYSTYLMSDGMCSIRTKRYDLLGNALAVLFGVADDSQSDSVLASYPVGPHGPCVVWPQERSVPIYHNQGIWPFVTAYWIKAACKQDNAPAVNLGIQTMQRLSARNLSNMENFDFVSGLADVRNKELNGPVINSQRQLWSVAGYLSMVQDVVFGLQASMTGIRFQPYITEELRNGMFASTDTLELKNFNYRGKSNNVRIHLPPAEKKGGGAYEIKGVTLNGKPIGNGYAGSDRLKSSNQWDVYLQVPESDGGKEASIHLVDVDNTSALYGPAMPQWDTMENGGITVENGCLKLHFQHPDASNVEFNIYRDGKLVAGNIKQTQWIDEASQDHASVAHCYAIEAIDPASGNASHLTPFICYCDEAMEHVIPARDMKNSGGDLVRDHHFENWGDRDDKLAADLTVENSGRYMVRAKFSNGAGAINTGVSCGVKKLEVLELASGKVVSSGYLVMPQSGSWERWDLSSPVVVDLVAGKKYELRILEDDYSLNMSYLKKNERYTKYPGGGDDGYNYVNIAAVHVDLVAAEDSSATSLVSNQTN